MARRIATIDLGTNTVLLLVAELDGGGRLTPIVERATITRLGKGVDATKTLAPDRVDATVACLSSYAATVSELGAELVDAVGTSAMRDATGGEPIEEAMQLHFGRPLRVISGREEAELTFLGATSGLDVQGASAIVVDVGGGSTELVRGTRRDGLVEIHHAESFDVGSVRLTERHLRGDPPTPESLAALERDLDATFLEIRKSNDTVIGVAGTVTTLLAIELALEPYDPQRVHGARIGRDALARLSRRLESATLAARRQLPGLEAGRADVIVAGARIVQSALRHLGREELVVSDRGVRWGLAERALQRHAAT